MRVRHAWLAIGLGAGAIGASFVLFSHTPADRGGSAGTPAALDEPGPDGARILALLRSHNLETRLRGASEAELGLSFHPSVTQALNEMLEDPNPYARASAAAALCRVSKRTPPLTQLAEALRSGEDGLVEIAAHGAARLGPGALPLLHALQAAFDAHPGSTVCARAILATGSDGQDWIATLLESASERRTTTLDPRAVSALRGVFDHGLAGRRVVSAIARAAGSRDSLLATVALSVAAEVVREPTERALIALYVLGYGDARRSRDALALLNASPLAHDELMEIARSGDLPLGPEAFARAEAALAPR